MLSNHCFGDQGILWNIQITVTWLSGIESKDDGWTTKDYVLQFINIIYWLTYLFKDRLIATLLIWAVTISANIANQETCSIYCEDFGGVADGWRASEENWQNQQSEYTKRGPEELQSDYH